MRVVHARRAIYSVDERRILCTFIGPHPQAALEVGDAAPCLSKLPMYRWASSGDNKLGSLFSSQMSTSGRPS